MLFEACPTRIAAVDIAFTDGLWEDESLVTSRPSPKPAFGQCISNGVDIVWFGRRLVCNDIRGCDRLVGLGVRLGERPAVATAVGTDDVPLSRPGASEGWHDFGGDDADEANKYAAANGGTILVRERCVVAYLKIILLSTDPIPDDAEQFDPPGVVEVTDSEQKATNDT
ncbi:hypothetical protein [Halorientalis marina]|uniref:hypothetical protein n=1 Tax=Halorientalis marina TaxID=2931976 RepID=UPI001FF2A831|nr:hypothetical protein [Halorientalis marina]